MKKGFTLIELLAVIVILAIILVIAVPQILGVIENTKISAFIENENMLVKATKYYLTSNQTSYPSNIGRTTEISLNNLISNNYISDIYDTHNIKTRCSGYLFITKTNESAYDYTPYLICKDGLIIDGYEDDNLVSYYKFDGNVYDYSPNNYNGIVNGTTFITNRFGESNKALDFFGSSNYITIPTISLANTNWTVYAWINTNNTSNFQSLLSNRNGDNAISVIGIDNSKIMYKHYDVSWKTEHGITNIQNNTWFFLTWVNHTNNTMDLYVNGKKENTVSSTLIDIGSAPLNTIGNNWVGEYWNGSLDDISIYNRSFTEEEVKYTYDIEKNRSK